MNLSRTKTIPQLNWVFGKAVDGDFVKHKPIQMPTRRSSSRHRVLLNYTNYPVPGEEIRFGSVQAFLTWGQTAFFSLLFSELCVFMSTCIVFLPNLLTFPLILLDNLEIQFQMWYSCDNA